MNNKPKPKPFAVGVVYGKDGSPRIEKDFLENMHPKVREVVKADLERHGWRLTDSNSVEKL
ncbi:MAG TPA: hypothetical protein VJ299_11115 [Steroidobacteraceae bacterium]|nr:hypothetical protein [Steroidobacteraceae bacterium]